MPKAKTMFQVLEGHEFFRLIEDELEERDISDEFLQDEKHNDSIQRVVSALNALEISIQQMQTESDAERPEEEEEADEDEDDDDE